MRRTLVIPLLLLAACASAPTDTPKSAPSGPQPAVAPTGTHAAAIPQKVTAAADLTDHIGDSMETAVDVPGKETDDGIAWERRWIFDHYGRFRIQKTALGHAGRIPAERRYSILTVELPDGSVKTIFFDVTDAWNNWKPPAQ